MAAYLEPAFAKVWVVGRTVELAAAVAVGGTAIDCSGNCGKREDSGWAVEKRCEAAGWQPWDGRAAAHSAVRMATADGMEVDDSELPGPLETQAAAGSGGHTGCASSVAEVLEGFVLHIRFGRSNCVVFRT